MSMIEIDQAPQKAVLFGTSRPDSQVWGDAPLEELSRLADTAGALVVDSIIQPPRQIDPKYFIGRGKAEEISRIIAMHKADIAIFDDNLSPSQGRNLETLFDTQVIDRTELILDIFAQHARTTESRLQVELAQLEYLLPRLKRMWVHLERHQGGIGTRGPGETQLETDRRLITTRISQLKKKLAKVQNQHEVRRKSRRGLINFALVGYTNAGKSSILSSLTDSDVYVRDQLFATLDTTTRRYTLPGEREVLVTDTVGFINSLPHDLVASFKATLDEVSQADHVLLVADISNPHFEKRIEVVESVLEDIGAGKIEKTLVFNKIDMVKDPGIIFETEEKYPNSVFTCARAGKPKLRHLIDRMTRILEAHEAEFSIDLPAEEGRLAALMHESGHVLERNLNEGRLNMRVRMRRSQLNRIMQNTQLNGQITFHGGNLD